MGFNVKRRILVILLLSGNILINSGCVNNNARQDAYTATLSLFDNIGKGTADNLFPTEYFPKEETTKLLSQLKDYCDFANRKGNFINDLYEKDQANGDVVSELFEFHLKCDDVRFIVSYRIKGNVINLFGFKMESVKKDNPMILSPEKRIYRP